MIYTMHKRNRVEADPLEPGGKDSGLRGPTVLFWDNRYMSLLHDPWFKSGGATKQVVAWVEGLMTLGASVKVVGAHEDPDFFKKHEHTIVSYDSRKGIPKLRYLYIRIPGMLRAFISSKAKYIYYGIPSPFAGVLASCAKVLRKKFILRISNDFFVDDRVKAKFDPFRSLWLGLGFRLADYILCQNDYQFSQLRAKYGEKVFKIGNPFLGALATDVRSVEDRKYVAWVGIFQDQKNLPLLLEIARALPRIDFRIAGGNDKKLSQTDQRALQDLNELPNVKLVGFLDREGVLDLLDNARLLLNTSHYEGFSNTFLEAFSRGTPVATLARNDPNQIVRVHRLGVALSSPTAAASAIDGFCQSDDAFREASSNCINYMRNHHDLTTQTREFLRIIEWKRELATTPAFG